MPSRLPFSPTRRSVIKVGAWSAPVIVVATAAPAFATSHTGALTLVRGSSAIVDSPDFPGYDDVSFVGAAIATTGSGIAAGALTLTVTFSGTTTNPDAPIYLAQTIPGWNVAPAAPSQGSTVVFTYTSAVAPGATLAIPDGRYFGSNPPRSGQQGTFNVTAAASEFSSGSDTFNTIPARPGTATRNASNSRT